MTGNGHGAVQVRVRAVRLVTVTEGATGGPGGPGVAMVVMISVSSGWLAQLTCYCNELSCVCHSSRTIVIMKEAFQHRAIVHVTC